MRLLSPQPQVVLVVAFCNFPGCAHLTTTWPSGLRRAVQVRVSQGAWVRIPPSSMSSLFPFRPPFFCFSYLSPFCPFPAGLSPIPAAFFLAFQNFTLLERTFFEAFSRPERDEGVPVLHTLLAFQVRAGPSQVQHQPAGTGPQTKGASKGNFAPCSQD